MLKNLDKLASVLPEELSPFLQYMMDFNNLMGETFGFSLGSDFRSRVRMFKSSFQTLNLNFGMRETPKIHILMYLVEDFVRLTGQSLGQHSEQEVESCHQTFDKCWDKYKVKDTSSEIFMDNLLRAVLDYNSSHI